MFTGTLFHVSQLLYDGLNAFASAVAHTIGIDIKTVGPSCDLYRICTNKINEDKKIRKTNSTLIPPEGNIDPFLEKIPEYGVDIKITTSCDLIDGTKNDCFSTTTLNDYETVYVTSHKAPCTVGVYSRNGDLIATGSEDTSIKILDPHKMLLKASETRAEKQLIDVKDDDPAAASKGHPVIKTLYDNTAPVTCLDFHPTMNFLASGGNDNIIRIFDVSKTSSRKVVKAINEVENLCNLAFHPSGNYLMVSTKHPTIRLYDLNTLKCFVSANPSDQHTGTVLSIKYKTSGGAYVTAGMDGCVKFWDGSSNRCFKTITRAHSGAPVVSVAIKSDSHTILTAGKDNKVLLWDMRNFSYFLEVDCPTQMYENCCPAVFNHTEDSGELVFYIEDKNFAIGCFNIKTGDKLPPIPSCHSSYIRNFAHSPVDASLITCSEDNRTRFWYAGHI